MDYLESLFSLEGRNALITGGGSGIGYLIAESMIRAGADVYIASRNLEKCKSAAATLNMIGSGGTAHALTADLSNEEGITALAAEMTKRTDHLSILVNNSGKTWGAPIGRVPYNSWASVFSVNVTAIFALCQALLPLLSASATSEAPSRIINIGSSAGTVPFGNGAFSYAASKAAVHHLTRVLARELALQHITVNAIAPGPFSSDLMRRASPTEADREIIRRSVPLRRWGEGDDIGAAALLLAGRGGAYITGTILPVDGGMTTNCGEDLTTAALG